MTNGIKQIKKDSAAAMAAVVREHDLQIRRRKMEIWLGAEPTFTNRFSMDPEWQTAALGEDKLNRARQFAADLAGARPGTLLLRTLGRQYANERTPRWSLGLYAHRDGRTIWRGPTDPIQHRAVKTTMNPSLLARCLVQELSRAGFKALLFKSQSALPVRVMCSRKVSVSKTNWARDQRYHRAPLDSQPVPTDGAQDELAAQGIFLLSLGPCLSGHPDDTGALQIELPAFPDTRTFLKFVQLLERAARAANVVSLVWTGFSPPLDGTVAWTTITPDPGVLEVNMAPCPNATSFLAEQHLLHATAGKIGLTSCKFLFNGDCADSGGGQHLTFGGRAPERSPFFRHPCLLPRLIAYLNRHPALSYWFAARSVGSSSQQPRPDEVARESFDGLEVALDTLLSNKGKGPRPEALWSSLAPFLTDRFGNTHRAEINVEKLWNPYFPGRGRLGLVELRAFGMTITPEDAAARIVLMRNILTFLAEQSDVSPLVHWGTELHDRFALPFYLKRDLEAVFNDLANHDLELRTSIRNRLLEDTRLVVGTMALENVQLSVRRALEFWPLTGSLSSPNETSRWMDSSTERVEVCLTAPAKQAKELASWQLIIDGRRVPWVMEKDGRQVHALRGIRYKSFHPQLPLLPLVNVCDPLKFRLQSPEGQSAWQVSCYSWKPNRGEYKGLPEHPEEADHRRQERFVVRRVKPRAHWPEVPSSALSDFTLDLRKRIRV